MTSSVRIVEITAAETHPLRTAVLRGGDPTRPVTFDLDAHPESVHLGALDEADELVAVSSWMPNPIADFPEHRSIQLRGMATAAEAQSTGIGGALFEAGVERATARGFTLIWARARDSALSFYDRHGCTVIGDGFIDDTTRLPHHVVVRRTETSLP
ncbi:MAG: GNAT family N-acetyltransferase [Ilumatobacteraceae bacterium]